MVAEIRCRRWGWSASKHLVNGQARVGGGRRGEVRSWSSGAARRNAQFLQSHDYAAMPSCAAWAVTLTTRGVIGPAQWNHALRRLKKWLEKQRGFECAHWVTEFQARGAAHLHMAVWGVEGRRIVARWLREVDALAVAQHVRRIRQAKHWAMYCAKHGARGLGHYQRNRERLRGAWRTESAGRMWGCLGRRHWQAARCTEDVWQFVGGEADYDRLAARQRRALGVDDASAFMRGCGAWGGFLQAMSGFGFRLAGSVDPPVDGETLSGVYDRRCLHAD